MPLVDPMAQAVPGQEDPQNLYLQQTLQRLGLADTTYGSAEASRLPIPQSLLMSAAQRGGIAAPGPGEAGGEGVVATMLQAPQVTEGSGPSGPQGAPGAGLQTSTGGLSPGGGAGIPPGQQSVIPAMLGPFGQLMPSSPSLVDTNIPAIQTPYGLMPLNQDRGAIDRGQQTQPDKNRESAMLGKDPGSPNIPN